uniref:Uncharacterized protein n=1 Tax=Quercus lobata TaxID=97700 RepID=A0A7N2R4J4_QUELO
MMGLLQRCKLSSSGRRTKVFNLILCPVLKEESRGSGKLIQPIYAVANAICSFTGETKEMQPEQPPEKIFTLATQMNQDSSVKALTPIRDTRLKNQGVQSNPVPSGNEESRGSTFLIQVKEKLSAEEYKKFVELMKALKSKEMKISQVLQSIVRLFSGAERLHLLERFKDYLPAKYHSLYEQHLVTNNDKL